VGPWLASGPLATGVRLGAHDGIFRIGNAAGEAHPIIGEGISMALQSAWMLSTHMLRGSARHVRMGTGWQQAVEHRYEQQWRRTFVPRMRLAAIFAHAAMNPLAGALLMRLLKRWPSLLASGAVAGGKCTEPALLHLAGAAPPPARELGPVVELGRSAH
jgi:flavin-dependent dehydrogenase